MVTDIHKDRHRHTNQHFLSFAGRMKTYSLAFAGIITIYYITVTKQN